MIPCILLATCPATARNLFSTSSSSFHRDRFQTTASVIVKGTAPNRTGKWSVDAYFLVSRHSIAIGDAGGRRYRSGFRQTVEFWSSTVPGPVTSHGRKPLSRDSHFLIFYKSYGRETFCIVFQSNLVLWTNFRSPYSMKSEYSLQAVQRVPKRPKRT
jgi:hypothetical protein